MKRALVLAFLLCPALALADTYVNGYFRSDGTYVPGHYRSSPNSTKQDNYSSKGNYNPYTGEKGTVDPYAPKTTTKPSPYSTYEPYQYKPVQPYEPYSYRRK